MKKAITILLSLMLIMNCVMLPVSASDGQRFPDVPEDAWFAPYVEALVARGAVNGYDDGKFHPQDKVTLGQALKLILLTGGYTDILPDGDHWAGGYLTFAKKYGYIAEGGYDLDAPIIRLDVAKLCAAVLELDLAAAADIRPFAETADQSVLALYESGIIVGSEENGQTVFHGDNDLTRAEVCAILYRMIPYVDTHFTKVSGVRAPINYGLRQFPYDTSAFHREENGRLVYDGADVIAHYGIDVSEHQGEVDWAQAAADGIEFAIIRCGYRGSSVSDIHEDLLFRQNIEGALAAGLDVGIYFFSQAITVDEALEEAEFTLSLIREYNLTYPVVFDWEMQSQTDSRTQAPDWDMVSNCAVGFCDAIKAAGYRPMVYYNKFSAYLRLDMSRLEQYDGWLAMYTNNLEGYHYDLQMWQYSAEGQVRGVNSKVDMNISFVPYKSA